MAGSCWNAIGENLENKIIEAEKEEEIINANKKLIEIIELKLRK